MCLVKKALIITGPTASGKTSLAFEIAKKFNGALISVDSVQIYKNCDIVSGKDLPSGTEFVTEDILLPPQFTLGHYKIDGVPLYLTDVIKPSDSFSVSDFIFLTKKILTVIEKKNMLPVFVGGTTLYIKSILTPPSTINIPQDPFLRTRLEKASLDELQTILARYDKLKLADMNNSDLNNPRRLVRAIEIAKSKIPKKSEKLEYKFLTIGLEMDRELLKNRIKKRVEQRLEKGAITEAQNLFKSYHSLSDNIKKSKGYEEIFEYLSGKVAKEEMIEKWKISEWKLAKNQMTFFKKMNEIKWFDIKDKEFPENIYTEVEKFLK
jgi:tRNA dimethylallyltransferase